MTPAPGKARETRSSRETAGVPEVPASSIPRVSPSPAPPLLLPRSRRSGCGSGRGGGTGPGPRPQERAGGRCSPTPLELKMDVKRVKDYLYWLYYQYQLVTCSYVLEPWEQSMFHTITVTVLAMVVYTAYVFVPIHVRLALEFFSQIFGSQPESAVLN
ncbi:serine palmitoyltransferase small subunit B isoform X1 [Parus major]|nr:serine palmitoyltransferase small subunit B isoform X1 [Parus major]